MTKTDDTKELVERVRKLVGARFPLSWGQQVPSGTSVIWPAIFDREGDLLAYCNSEDIQEALLETERLCDALESLTAERDRLREALENIVELSRDDVTRWDAAEAFIRAGRALTGDDEE